MSLIKPDPNPIMNMQNEVKWIETLQGLSGMLSMIFLMLIVRDDVKLIPLETAVPFFVIHTVNGLLNYILIPIMAE